VGLEKHATMRGRTYLGLEKHATMRSYVRGSGETCDNERYVGLEKHATMRGRTYLGLEKHATMRGRTYVGLLGTLGASSV
jgi:hypothetical protein